MKKMTILILWVCFFFATALVGQADEFKKATVDKHKKLSIKLKGSQFNTAAIGMATFVSRDDNSSSVSILMGGISRFIKRPVRIYTFIYPGSCENLGETPAYVLNNIKITNESGHDIWEASRRIPVALGSLLENDYTLVIRSTNAEGNRDLFCGDIR